MRFLMLNWRDPRNPKAGGAERVTQAYLEALIERESARRLARLGGSETQLKPVPRRRSQ